jgi:hypothetical protein
MAWRNPFKRKPDLPVTASAVSATTRYDGDAARRQDRRVSEAWEIWRLVGEVHYATSQQSRLVGRLGWKVTVNGTEWEDEPATEALTAAFGSLSRLRDLQVKAATHLQVAGGYHLAKMGDTWDILNNPADGPTKKKLESADIVVKVENPDPQTPAQRLDSPVLAALDIGRELILARAQARAMARSRTAQLKTVVFPTESVGQDRQAFEQQLIDVMTAPLADEMSTAAVVPNFLFLPQETIAAIAEFDFTGNLDDKVHERIDRLVNQLATILDIPREILLGSGDANHWGAWLISEDNYLNHVEPLASPIGEGFASALEILLGTGEDGQPSTDVDLKPDPQNLLKRRPTIADSLKAAELGIVSETWAAEQLGASEEDMGPGLLQVLEARRAIRTTRDEGPASEEPGTTAAAVQATPEPKAITAAASQPDPRRLAQLDVEFGEAMTDLVSDAADRALERLGARLRSVAQGGKVDLPDVPNQQVAIAYTQEIPNQAETVDDTAGKFEPQFDRFTERAFRRLRDAGVELHPAKADQMDAFGVFRAEVSKVVAARRTGATGDAETWRASLRINSILGGSGDPEVNPVVSAAGFPVSPAGIALGRRSVSAMAQQYGVVPGKGSGTTHTGDPTPTPNT